MLTEGARGALTALAFLRVAISQIIPWIFNGKCIKMLLNLPDFSIFLSTSSFNCFKGVQVKFLKILKILFGF